MCFSAEASFVGAGVVGAVGVATLTQVRRPHQVLLAALPLGFAAHQALEGVTWLELDGATDAVLRGWGVHLWVLFAWALLPTWVPVGVRLIEPDARRRRRMVPLVVVGGVLSAFMVTQALDPGIAVGVVGGELDYHLPLDIGIWLATPYVLATCSTPILSSHRWVRIFGVGNVMALTAAAILEAADFSSIWCTFAAFLSALLLVHFATEARQPDRPVDDPDPRPQPTGSA
ncbi:MAG: DUF6629 family protein [Acidimicrobiia bacterium]|nr:DUF6629 family protein [Acidimicrobiia bacterium]